MKLVCFISLLLCRPLLALSAGTDTTYALRQFAEMMKGSSVYTIEYTMDATFPNGNKDHLAGTLSFDAKAKYYYNNCNEYTMLYTRQWFYQANHLEKTILLIDLQKQDKKIRHEREQNIFGNGLLSAFVDSVLLQKGKVRSLSYKGSVCSMIVGFAPKNYVEKLEFSYDTANHMPVTCRMETIHPMDAKNIRTIVNYTNFRNRIDSVTTADMLFMRSKSKVILIKYNTYKLISKI